MNRIKNYFASRKEAYRKNHENAIRDSFDVAERNGEMWLTHNGVAFMKVSSLSYASDVTKELNKARECAVEFERL